jgi:uncharacterized OB-fold protein
MIDAEALRDFVYKMDSDVADIPFWEACDRQEFLLHRCNVCERHYWPAAKCVVHGERDMEWVPASGRGVIHDYVIMRRAYSAEMKDKVPYNVSIIELEEGPLFHSNVIDCPVEEIASGIPVEVTFVPHSSGLTIPVFKKRT